MLADGPAGLRINPTRESDSQTYYCTHFPIGTLLASTWDQQLVEKVGEAIGNEVLEYGTDVLLAPALNIHRNPLCGRNFEYYSEDPVVSGKIAAAYVRGVQNNGVGTSVKHFALNNQETNRDEWGFGGMVMTDWFGGKDAVAQMVAGNDMLQPGTDKQYEMIVSGVKEGRLDEAVLDRNVKRILEMILRTPRFQGYRFSNKPDLEAHAAVTRQSATEGMVLLKNENEALPLSAGTKRIALLGCTSYDFIAGGTGSGNVNRAYTVSLLDGLKQAGYELDGELKTAYEQHIAAENERNRPDTTNRFAMFLPRPRPTEMMIPAARLQALAKANDVALITLGRTSGEFLDRKKADFELTREEKALLNDVCRAFHAAGKKVVVVLNIGGVIETASWKNRPDAILCAWQAGQEGGNSVADVLSGKASPSGKLTMTFPVHFADAASSANFPIDMAANMDISNSGEKKNSLKNVDYTDYEEDIYVGYRYFDTFGKEVSYPFGYGLSYTTFEYAAPRVETTEDAYLVSVQITNTGKRAGKEAVQLYVAAPDRATANKPEKELKAFAKTRELQPGETETLVLKLPKANLASFDTASSAWVVTPGSYDLLLGASSRDIRAKAAVDAAASSVPVGDLLKPQGKLRLLERSGR